jgi:acyl-CoA synthetase (AMP-forming)/AMP-acid ligase II
MRYDYNLGRHFETVAARHAERPALRLAADRQVSYGELARTVDPM